jgi:hypothetical protein
MARLVGELRSNAFLAAHPVQQAAYAHYGLVVIHPFADGNGRVARALASAFTYRAISMPIVILSEHKNAYLDALEGADSGDYQIFVDFMLARSLDTIKLVDESVRTAMSPSPEETIEAIQSLYVTRGGYTYEQIDSAGIQLITAVLQQVQQVKSQYPLAKLTANVVIVARHYNIPESAYRAPLIGGRSLQVGFTLAPPASAGLQRLYDLWLPRDAGGDDDVLFRNEANPADTLVARIDELLPVISGILQIRINIFAERVVREMLGQLRPLAEKALRTRH